MKYGLLIYFGSSYCNYGDYVQSIAIEYLYTHIMKIPQSEIVYITEEEIGTYKGEQLLLPYSYVLSFLMDAATGEAKVSENITVVFLGASVEFATLYDAYPLENFQRKDKKFIDLFLKFSPVGCRDNATKELLRSYGVSAYLQGCITNILPVREKKEYKKIFLIDVPKEALAAIPAELLPETEVICNADAIGELTYEQNYQRIKERYEYYRDNAALIISSRYHIVTPCNAMGIPCIFVKRTVDKHRKDIRLDTLNPSIQIVCDNDFSGVDFGRKNIVEESQKELKREISELAASRIRTTKLLYENGARIYEFFRPRIEWFRSMPDAGDSYKERLTEFIKENHRTGKARYYIWGAIKLLCDGDNIVLVDLVREINRDLQFAGWIDSFKTGELAKKEIVSPESYTLGENDFVIVAAETAVDAALDNFKKKGYQPQQFLILANTMIVQKDLDRRKAEQENA